MDKNTPKTQVEKISPKGRKADDDKPLTNTKEHFTNTKKSIIQNLMMYCTPEPNIVK
jgi:hypothetical protein